MTFFDILRFGAMPMIMAPEGDPAGGGGGGDPAPAGGDPAPNPEPSQTADPAPSGGDPAPKPTAAPAGNQQPAGDPPAAGDEPKPLENTFPDNWREQLATDDKGNVDEKLLKNLKRFNSPKDLNVSYQALQQKVSSGEYKKPLDKDATPEQVAAFRKENGIPEKPEGYLSELPEGLVFGENDKAVLDPFLKDMHEKNVHPAAVQSALNAYQQARQAQTEAIQARDVEIAKDTEDALRLKWGADYRGNMTAVNAFLDSNFPAEMKDALMNARLGDNDTTPLLHHPAVLESFANLGRLLNPQPSMGGRGMDTLESINDQIAKYESQMGDKNSSYWKNQKDQDHYLELLRVKERMDKVKPAG